jgi:hypothetical protein
MTFELGQSGNPNGRPLGKRDNKYRKYQEAAEREGLEDPVLFLHRKINDPTIDLALRASMAANILPYYCPKWGTVAPPPVPIYNEHPIGLLPPTTVEIAKENISKLIAAYDLGKIDQVSYDRLIAGNVAMINALLGQAKIPGAEPHDTIINISGGLPQIPGTTIGGMEHYPTVNSELVARLTNGHKLLDTPQNPSSIDGVHTAEPPETKAPE